MFRSAIALLAFILFGLWKGKYILLILLVVTNTKLIKPVLASMSKRVSFVRWYEKIRCYILLSYVMQQQHHKVRSFGLLLLHSVCIWYIFARHEMIASVIKVFSMLSGVQSTQNLALGKYAEQSSTSNPEFPATKVVDGNSIDLNNCSTTETDTNPFWIVDLAQMYRISHVTITTSWFLAGKHIELLL